MDFEKFRQPDGYFYFVYKTINLINGKYYYGQHMTDNIDDDYVGSGKRIRLAIKKHGKQSFRREIIVFGRNEEDINRFEEKLITKEVIEDPMCYNLRFGGGSKGRLSDETKRKMSDSLKGKKHSEEHKQKIREAKKGRKMPALSEEHKRKISEVQKGKKKPARSEEYKRKMSDSQKGRKHSEEAKKKMRKAKTDKRQSKALSDLTV